METPKLLKRNESTYTPISLIPYIGIKALQPAQGDFSFSLDRYFVEKGEETIPSDDLTHLGIKYLPEFILIEDRLPRFGNKTFPEQERFFELKRRGIVEELIEIAQERAETHEAQYFTLEMYTPADGIIRNLRRETPDWVRMSLAEDTPYQGLSELEEKSPYDDIFLKERKEKNLEWKIPNKEYLTINEEKIDKKIDFSYPKKQLENHFFDRLHHITLPFKTPEDKLTIHPLVNLYRQRE